MGNNPLYAKDAARLGEIMGKQGFQLIFGGSNIGLMTVIADAVLANGGEVVGVMPKNLVARKIVHKGLTHFYEVANMAERKQLMGDLSDAFVAMPGGFGTLDELAEVLTWLQLELMDKPVAVLNTKGYFDHFLKFLDHARDEKFLRVEHRQNIVVQDNPDDLLSSLIKFEPVPVYSKWVDELKKESGL